MVGWSKSTSSDSAALQQASKHAHKDDRQASNFPDGLFVSIDTKRPVSARAVGDSVLEERNDPSLQPPSIARFRSGAGGVDRRCDADGTRRHRISVEYSARASACRLEIDQSRFIERTLRCHAPVANVRALVALIATERLGECLRWSSFIYVITLGSL